MAYSKNPHLPRVRMRAVLLVRQGWSIRKVARHLGFHHTAVMRWLRKAPLDGRHGIPTESSRPHKNPRALSQKVVSAIISKRMGRKRCGQVIHQELLREGIVVSLSSIQRTLERCHLLKKRSPWKRPHDYTPRPEVTHSGALLQADTIHIIGPDGKRIYIYTLIDLYSRWTYAEAVEKIGAQQRVRFMHRAVKKCPFIFELIQTDHGSEFSIWFTHSMWRLGITHRHARVRQKNDNAHIERFNRTIQEECLDSIPHRVSRYKKAISHYLLYYNTERLHMGLNFKTPLEVVRSY